MFFFCVVKQLVLFGIKCLNDDKIQKLFRWDLRYGSGGQTSLEENTFIKIMKFDMTQELIDVFSNYVFRMWPTET